MCGGGSTTSVSSQNPNPTVAANYDYITGRAKGVADIPFEYYPGNLVAPTTGQTQSGYDIINSTQGVAAPFISRATQFAEQGAAPISAGAIQSYMNPYNQSVIDATMANIDEMNARQQQDVIGNAISKGAWGGDRAGVAQAELARQQGLAAGQTIAGLNAQNYQQALTAAQQDAQRQAQGAYTMGALGQEAQSTALTGANAQVAAGQLQQQQAQNEINATYGQYQQAKQYPFNTTQWLAGILGGQAGQMGGTSTTTSPAPGIAQQAIGAGAGIAGILGATGAFGSSGWLWSDERLKENIEPIGRAFDGQMIYRYNFKGDPKTQIGFLAQEVERHQPGAVRQTIDGIKGVDYHEATDDAAERGGFDAGGIVDLRAPLIPSIDSYKPDTDSTQLGPLVSTGYELKSISKPAFDQATRGGFAPGGVALQDPDRAADRALRRMLAQWAQNNQSEAVPGGGPETTLPPRRLPDITTQEGLLQALGNQYLDMIGSRDPRTTIPGADTLPGYDDGGVVPYGDALPFPALGAVNGVPIPAATVAPGKLRAATMHQSGMRGLPPPPKAPGTSDIGSDVIRLAQMLRASGLGKGGGRGPGEGGGYADVGELVRSLGLARGGRARKRFAGGGFADEEEGAWGPPVIVKMPPPPVERVGLFPTELPVGPREPAAAGVVPITTALEALRDETQGAPAPSGVVAPPSSPAAPMVVAAAPPVAGSFYDRWAAGESNNNPQATNPSGAAGRLQVMPGTYRAARAAIPGLPDDPRRTTVDQDKSISDWYRAQAASVLTRALGRAPTEGELGLSTLAGPAGASALLRLDPATPLASLPQDFWQRMGEKFTHQTFLAQNPAIARLGTVGGVVDFFRQRFEGGAPTSVAAAPPGGGGVADDGGDEGGGVQGAGVAGAPPAGRAGGVAPPDGGGDDRTKPKGDDDWADRFMQSPWLALAQLGFGMAGSRNPTLLGALGEGGLQGVQTAMAQGKTKREFQQAKAMEAYRNAQLGLSREASERQARILEKNLVKDERVEAGRQAAERDRLRVIELREGREAREAEEKRMARARFMPDKDKAVDFYTGMPVYRNAEGEERLRLPDGRLVTRDEALKTTGGVDSRVETTIKLPSGKDVVIPAADPREATLDSETRKKLAAQGADIAKQASAATALMRVLKEVQTTFNELPKSGPGAPGALAEAWRKIGAASQAVTDTLGLPPMIDPKTVGSLQELNKLTAQLAAVATKNLTARPAVFEFQKFMENNPNASMTPDAMQKIVGFMLADAQRAVDLGAYAKQYQLRRRSLYGVEEAFNQQQPDHGTRIETGRGQSPGAPAPGSSPANPVTVATPAEAAKLPKGTYFRSPDGKTRQVP
jgi:hypothetical protein